jgi:hypothetical protein
MIVLAVKKTSMNLLWNLPSHTHSVSSCHKQTFSLQNMAQTKHERDKRQVIQKRTREDERRLVSRSCGPHQKLKENTKSIN